MFIFGYPKLLFFDIQNNFFWISKIPTCFGISKIVFQISGITIPDIWKKWKNVNSACRTCGLQTVQISIPLTMLTGLSCSILYTRQKSTPSTNWSSGWLKSGAAMNSQLSTWLLISGVEDLELVCMRKEDTLNITFELTDCVDFVNNLSPYVLCFV